MTDTHETYEFPNRFGEVRAVTTWPKLTISQQALLALILRESVDGAEKACIAPATFKWTFPEFDAPDATLRAWGMTHSEETEFLRRAAPYRATQGEILDDRGLAERWPMTAPDVLDFQHLYRGRDA